MIYLVRHGQTVFNAEGRLQGHVDSPLTEVGQAQARRVGQLMKQLIREPAGWRLVSSPLMRAQATASAISEALGLPIETHPELIEVSFGVWDGRLRSDLQVEFPDTFGPTGYRFASPDCEPYEAVVERLSAWLGRLEPEGGRRIIAVSHGVTGRVLRGLYGGLSREAALALNVPQDAAFRLSQGRIEQFDAP